MPDNRSYWNKIALICALVGQAGHARFGRTALMKILYFLKVLKGVPVRYNFGFYTYGPFDSSVLEDLSYAEALNAVKSTLIQFPSGYGYALEAGPQAGEIKKLGSEFLSKYKDEINSVVGEFGSYSAGKLEILSTIIYVDRSTNESGEKLSVGELAEKVCEVKPNADKAMVVKNAEELRVGGHLTSFG